MKEDIHAALVTELNAKRAEVEKHVVDLQDSVNNETKSSAGDKHETGRAMAQLEVEQRVKSLLEIENLIQQLKRIDPQLVCQHVTQGALVETDLGVYYVSVGLGVRKISEKLIFCIGQQAPIYQQMKSLKEQEEFVFQGKRQKIKHIS
jgi:hypothetical protein